MRTENSSYMTTLLKFLYRYILTWPKQELHAICELLQQFIATATNQGIDKEMTCGIIRYSNEAKLLTRIIPHLIRCPDPHIVTTCVYLLNDFLDLTKHNGE